MKSDRYDGPNRTRWRNVYGHPDGRWLLVEGPCEFPVRTPGRIGDLMYMGDGCGLVSHVYGWLRAQGSLKRPVQAALADRLGVGQQAISRYDRGMSYPDLPDEGWSELVRLWFSVPPHWSYGDPVPATQ